MPGLSRFSHEMEEDLDPHYTFLHRGIAARSFEIAHLRAE